MFLSVFVQNPVPPPGVWLHRPEDQRSGGAAQLFGGSD